MAHAVEADTVVDSAIVGVAGNWVPHQLHGGVAAVRRRHVDVATVASGHTVPAPRHADAICRAERLGGLGAVGITHVGDARVA